MKLAAKYDIEAPADFVYRELSDFDAWERMAMRRGVEVVRAKDPGTPGPGLEWQVGFTLRGKPRKARLRLTAATPDSHMAIGAESDLVNAEMRIELLDLSPSRTRVTVQVEAKPRTLAARIYMQTLRLARKKLDASFSQRVAQLAVEMEDRYRRPTSRRV